MTRGVDRRRFLQALAAGTTGGLAGCNGWLAGQPRTETAPASTPTETATPSPTATPAPFRHDVLQRTYESVRKQVGQARAAAFLAALSADDVPAARVDTLAGQLEQIDATAEFGVAHRDGVALGLTVEGSGLTQRYVRVLARIRSSEVDFQTAVLEYGLVETDDGYAVDEDVEGFGLTETTGTGVADGVEDFFLGFVGGVPEEVYGGDPYS